MKQLLQAIIMMFVLTFPAYAADSVQSNIDLSGLNDQQRADIIKQVADTKAQATSPMESVTPASVAEWIGVGKEVAELIPVFAEKTGIAADKVLDSFSGKGAPLHRPRPFLLVENDGCYRSFAGNSSLVQVVPFHVPYQGTSHRIQSESIHALGRAQQEDDSILLIQRRHEEH